VTPALVQFDPSCSAPSRQHLVSPGISTIRRVTKPSSRIWRSPSH